MQNYNHVNFLLKKYIYSLGMNSATLHSFVLKTDDPQGFKSILFLQCIFSP